MSATEKSIDYLKPFLTRKAESNNSKPLIIGIGGPQGSGKTYLASNLRDELSSLFPSLTIVNFSMDDFYLTYDEQQQVSQNNPDNMLLQGRGLPGTHDLELLLECFAKIENGNANVSIPVYDKSLHNGKGDRSSFEQWTHTGERIIDVVIFEGWFNGYLSYSKPLLISNWEKVQKEWCPKFDSLNESHILKLNNDLKEYSPIWEKFDCFVYLTTQNLTNVYKWRTEQEHALIKSKGIGMSDSQVESFVDRYMPAYYLYYHRLSNITNIVGDCLNIDIGLNRKVVSVDKALL